MELQCVDVRRKRDKFHVMGKEMASILQISPTQEKDWLFESNCMSASLEMRLNETGQNACFDFLIQMNTFQLFCD